MFLESRVIEYSPKATSRCVWCGHGEQPYLSEVLLASQAVHGAPAVGLLGSRQKLQGQQTAFSLDLEGCGDFRM